MIRPASAKSTIKHQPACQPSSWCSEVVLFCVVKEVIPLAWVNIPVFDYKGTLRSGEHQLYMWQVTDEALLTEELLNPIGIQLPLHLYWCHTCNFIAHFCCATLSCDKTVVCNCACCNCIRSHKLPLLRFSFTNWVHKIWNCSKIFLFWALILNLYFRFVIELTKTKLLARISSFESQESMFVMQFVAVQHVQLHMAIKLRDRIVRYICKYDISVNDIPLEPLFTKKHVELIYE